MIHRMFGYTFMGKIIKKVASSSKIAAPLLTAILNLDDLPHDRKMCPACE